ncbi:MAG: isoprenylcysteine carboxylmethyltransferase family protein [Sphingobium sp.]|nr:isoprenylcysteine carboxylmethyltransferase family protein [Sphingobium sp.]
MFAPRMVILACWTIFWTSWLIMAFGVKKNRLEQPANERRRYTLPLLLGLLLMSNLIRTAPPLAFLARRIEGPGLVLAWIGAGMAVIGLLIALWARVSLGRNWSGVVTLKEDHELVTRGPYAAIRHPIYTALILLFFALAFFIDTPVVYLGSLCILWSCWVKLKQEEALMLQQFPESYPAYMARTKRLVPGLV